MEYPQFTKEMKATHTILIPTMAPIHFGLLQEVFQTHGYTMRVLENAGPQVAEKGLRYVHNDTCYPALLVIGQFIDALDSGRFDLQRTALMITQTGGGCRASNYIHLLRKALVKAGYGQIPVISLNLSGLERGGGFSFTFPMLRKALSALIYGDLMMLLSNQVRPYETVDGTADGIVRDWQQRLSGQFAAGHAVSLNDIKRNLDDIANSFAKVQTQPRTVTKVGVVGEIYVKYSSLGNNNLEQFLQDSNCEVMVPGLLNFMLFKIDNRIEDIKLYGGSSAKKLVCSWLFNYVRKLETALLGALAPHEKFARPATYQHIKSLVRGVIGYGNKMGEGWLLTAEMLELAESGYENIVCAQPFGCLPNHICGKAMIRKIRAVNPKANIVAVDYDPSATRVNQENRIKLMLSVAQAGAGG